MTDPSICQHCGQTHAQGVLKCPTTGYLMSAPGVVGQRVDRYQVERLLGIGGFGAVYRARHVHTDATVALKLLKRELNTDASMIERFMREAKAASAVGSPHIVGVLDAGIAADAQAFLVLEFLDGWDLKDLIYREGPQSPQRLLEIVLQVLEGLAAAHARGVVHRDMKPANVFILHRDGRDFVKVLDFGISKMHQEPGAGGGLTMTGVAMGTPSYMAPEQFFDARSVDGRADLYSVAVMLYELLAARLPFEADSYAALVVKVRTEVPPPLQSIAPQLPAALCAAIDRGLAREREQRWPTAQQFADGLRTSMAGLSSTPLKATAARLPAETPSMLTGKTSTPTPQGRAPAPLRATPHALTPASFGPTPARPPAPPAPVNPTPALAPPSFGGAPPLAPVAPATPASTKSKTWLWVLIGLAVAGCCTCGGLASIGAQNQQRMQNQGY